MYCWQVLFVIKALISSRIGSQGKTEFVVTYAHNHGTQCKANRHAWEDKRDKSEAFPTQQFPSSGGIYFVHTQGKSGRSGISVIQFMRNWKTCSFHTQHPPLQAIIIPWLNLVQTKLLLPYKLLGNQTHISRAILSRVRSKLVIIIKLIEWNVKSL